jgi:hypothetical protein
MPRLTLKRPPGRRRRVDDDTLQLRIARGDVADILPADLPPPRSLDVDKAGLTRIIENFAAAGGIDRATGGHLLDEMIDSWHRDQVTEINRVFLTRDPRRRAPLPRQVILVLMTVALDGVACYFAAQALGGSQGATWVWTGLFLAVLAGGEVALDFYRDRNLRVWRALGTLTAVFVTLLGILRFWFLATIGPDGLVRAITGAFVFTAGTAGFLCLGYRALRAAETPRTWRARREAGKAWQAARAARMTADLDARERDRLILAYLRHVRRLVLKTYPVDVQVALESAVRSHLADRCH